MPRKPAAKKAAPKFTHGGARPGAGRPASDEPTKPYSMRLTATEREALDALGGAQFFRDALWTAMGWNEKD